MPDRSDTDAGPDPVAGSSDAPPPLDPAPLLTPPAAVPPGFVAPDGGRDTTRGEAGTRPRGGGWRRLLLWLLLLSLLGSVLLNLLLSAAVSQTAATGERVLHAGDPSRRVVVLPVTGGIDDAQAERVIAAVRRLERNPPAALVLRVDSGGGGVSASDRIWHALDRFRVRYPEVPRVASFGSVAASGGYYVAAGSDHIVCEPTGITGSIGVIAQVPSLEDLARRAGVEVNTVLADGSPKKATANNLFEDWRADDGGLTPAGVDNRAVLKKLTNAAWERFVEVVDAGRADLDRAAVRDAASGEVYTADEAVTLKLIDQTGYLEDAVAEAARRAGVDPAAAHVTEVSFNRGLAGLLGLPGVSRGSGAGWPATARGWRAWLDELGEVRLAYRIRW